MGPMFKRPSGSVWDLNHQQQFSNDLDLVGRCVDCGRLPIESFYPKKIQQPWLNQENYEGRKIATHLYISDGKGKFETTAINEGTGKCRFCYFQRCQIILQEGNKTCLREAKGWFPRYTSLLIKSEKEDPSDYSDDERVSFDLTLMCGLHLSNHLRLYEKQKEWDEKEERRKQWAEDRLGKEIKAIEIIEELKTVFKAHQGWELPDSLKLKGFDEGQHKRGYGSWDGENLQMEVTDFIDLLMLFLKNGSVD